MFRERKQESASTIHEVCSAGVFDQKSSPQARVRGFEVGDYSSVYSAFWFMVSSTSRNRTVTMRLDVSLFDYVIPGALIIIHIECVNNAVLSR